MEPPIILRTRNSKGNSHGKKNKKYTARCAIIDEANAAKKRASGVAAQLTTV
jgi:hypothetical protein